MADQDETIKIVVEVVDKFSKPLVDLKRQLETISDQGKGPKSVATNFDTLRESMVGVARTVQSLVMPSLRVLGLGFAGLAGTLAAATAALKGFATSTAELSRLSRETGFTIDKMRELEAAGRRVGISSNEMRAGFRNFSDEMDKMRVGVSTAARELQQRGLGFVVEGLKARAGDLNKQLDYAVTIIDRISNPRHKREVARLVGLPENFGTLSAKEREAAIAEYKKSVGAVTKEAEAASKRFEENMQRLANSMESLVNKLAENGGLDAIATSLKSIADNLEYLVGKAARAKKAIDENQTEAQSNVLKRPEPPGRPLTIWEQLFGLNNPLFGGGKAGGGTFAPDDSKTKETIKEGVYEGLKKMSLETGDTAPGSDGGGGTPGSGMPNVIRASLGGSSGGYRGGGYTRGSGESEPAQTGRVSMPGNRRAVAGVMADELRKSGLSDDAIAGIMANVRDESNFNPNLRHPDQPKFSGEAHYAHGLYQEGGTEWNNYAKWLKENHPEADWRDPRLQTRFLAHRIKTGYPALWKKLQSAGKSGAAIAFLRDYLKPAAGHMAARTGKYSRGVPGVEAYTGGDDGGTTAGDVPLPKPRPQINDQAPAAVPRERMMDASLHTNQFARVEGDARVRIELAGFPRGTKTQASSSGIFSEVELHRGNTLPLASESA